MSRTSRAEWAKRVERWKDSGLTAKEFAAETGLNASTLSYWKWKLRSDADGSASSSSRGASGSGRRRRRPSALGPNAGFVELMAPSPVSSHAESESMLELVLGGVRVRVPAGFDEATLTRVVRALEASR